MTESLNRLLLRLSEAGEPAILWGRQAKPYLGGDFDRLFARGVLIEEAAATEWDVCATCECELDVRPIQTIDGRLVAACPYDRMGDTSLDRDDVRTFSINPAAVVREIAAVSGFTDEPSPIASGVWQLGITPGKRMLFLALSKPAVLQAGLVPTLRSVAKAWPISLLTPAMPAADHARFADAGIYAVPITDALAPNTGGQSFALRLDDLTPRPTAEPVLILTKARQSITLDGHETTLPQRSFELLWLLSEVIAGGGGIVTRRQIEQRLWGTQVVSKTAAADAVRDLRGQLAGSAGRPSRSGLVETRQGKGYILALTADAIQLVA